MTCFTSEEKTPKTALLPTKGLAYVAVQNVTPLCAVSNPGSNLGESTEVGKDLSKVRPGNEQLAAVIKLDASP